MLDVVLCRLDNILLVPWSLVWTGSVRGAPRVVLVREKTQ
jgi:hypothetical protein